MRTLLPLIALSSVGLAADPKVDTPLIGTWENPGQGGRGILELKDDGTGGYGHESAGGERRLKPFKWEKTAEGATLRFDVDVDGVGNRTLFLSMEKAPDRVRLKSPKWEQLFRRYITK